MSCQGVTFVDHEVSRLIHLGIVRHGRLQVIVHVNVIDCTQVKCGQQSSVIQVIVVNSQVSFKSNVVNSQVSLKHREFEFGFMLSSATLFDSAQHPSSRQMRSFSGKGAGPV
jgi:hypothetical protein